MSHEPLPQCRHRGEAVALDQWECASPKLVVPGGRVRGETCRNACPYVDHAPDPRFSILSGDMLVTPVGDEMAVRKKTAPIRVQARPELFAIGMLTAPRSVSLAPESVRQLRQAGFCQTIHVFAEPGSPALTDAGVAFHPHAERLGGYANFCHAARHVLSVSDAPYVLLCEDDILLAEDAALGLQHAIETLATDDLGYLSLYTPWFNVRGKRLRVGWQPLPVGYETRGALAWCFSRASLELVLRETPASPLFPDTRATDVVVSALFAQHQRPCYFHVPSLCEHAGKHHSTQGHNNLPESDGVGFSTLEEMYVGRRQGIEANEDHRPSAVFLTLNLWDFGGVEEWFRTLSRSTADAFRWTVAVATSPPTGQKSVERLRVQGVEIADGRQLARVLENADIVVAWVIAPGVGGVPHTKAPVLLIAHGPDEWTGTNLAQQRRSPTLAGVVAVSEACRRIASDAIVLPNGVDLERLDRRDDTVEKRVLALRRNARTRVVGFIGRLSFEKNPVLAAAACSRLEDTAFVIFGPPIDPSLLPRIMAANPQTSLFAPTEAVGSVLRSIDCLAIPSLSEGGPLVALEALCAGVPIASTTVGLMPEIAHQACGSVRLSEAATVEDFAVKIAEALTDEAKAAAIRNRDAMRLVWGEAAFAERWKSILLQTIQRQS